MISGIQHFGFCRRQWALIHIENQWAENARTTSGQLMHKNAHDSKYIESRGDILIYRNLRIKSDVLGFSGACDVVEFQRDAGGITLKDREGLWRPFPVEYKHGEPKENNCDRLQLCLEAICLEEMLCCEIPDGAIYYEKIRHREWVQFDETLRTEVVAMAQEMHEYFKRGYTPHVKQAKKCNACSLKEICVPKMFSAGNVKEYLKNAVGADDETIT